LKNTENDQHSHTIYCSRNTAMYYVGWPIQGAAKY